MSAAILPTPRPAASQATSILSVWDDRALVEALLGGHRGATAELFDRYAHHVERILVRILGHDHEVADLLHEVFARLLAALGTLQDPGALKGWLTGITVFTARECIRRRVRGRWLRFFAPEDLPDVESVATDEETREALRVTYALLDRLGADDRIAFTLRFFEGLEIVSIASACGVSINTAKRRIARAQRRFVALAEREPALKAWLEGGTRWERS